MTAMATASLAGKRVVVTRARRQAAPLIERLAALGAEVIELPAIEIVPAASAALDQAVRDVETYDWVVWTSANGVDAFLTRLAGLGRAPSSMSWPRVAAIGPATAARLGEYGIPAALVPARYVAESLLEAMVERGVVGQRVLLPRAEHARDVLPDGLRAAGAHVDVVAVYQTRQPGPPRTDSAALLLDGSLDAITFASPSAARAVAVWLGDRRPTAEVVCIGPVTAAAAEACGFHVDAVAAEHSVPGLVDAVVAVTARRETKGDTNVPRT
jgi:uroporphyrinogen-III synthase